MISKASEYDDVKFAAGDKGIINELLKKSLVRYKESVKVKELWEKIFYCIQIVLGDIKIDGAYGVTFNSDCQRIVEKAGRLAKGTDVMKM